MKNIKNKIHYWGKNSFVLFLWLVIPIVSAQTVFFQKENIPAASSLFFAIQDAESLLLQAGAKVQENKTSAKISFSFVLKKNNKEFATLYKARNKENDAFQLKLKNENKIEIEIAAFSSKGASNGLYYFLQNYLGFQFYHPKETFIPTSIRTQFPNFKEKVEPRFHKIGFHIHAMHPLELTEALLDANYKNGEKEVQDYIQWLSRNGQNYFEFNLLSSIDLDSWIPYMRKIIQFAHDRDILVGADLSMNMIQQRAFQLYKGAPHTFENKKKQMLSNIAALTKLEWDLWNVEMATTEFTHKNQEKLYQQQKFLYDQLHPKNIELTGRKHVVKDENLVSNEKSMKKALTDMDSAYGVLVHTVMFYGLLDEKTPVYRNENFEHLKDLLIESNAYRETWYFPESAYWITFDNSVPMFLTSYLSARLQDILYCESLGIDGHLTFSSGWEWNYWLVDWSIARWSFKSDANAKKETATMFLKPFIGSENVMNFVNEVADLQELYIKDKQLIKVLTAQTVTDEIPGKLNLEFHPRPEFPYPFIRNEANAEQLEFLENKYIHVLKEFIGEYKKLRANVENLHSVVEKEIVTSLDVTALRAEHRLNTLQFLITYRKNALKISTENAEQYLENAASIRLQALKLVKEQEKRYRYPLQELVGKKKSKTVYNFGYLYPTTELHFWEREELQAKNNYWNFWYRSIWDVFKIIGVK